ncbi:hypothetical protein ABW19_dt0203161 [Dactylella cylindrospora]|nr:hypothetical protein ABW19_dt0203161 [Dactylella cylindrospora]
MSKPTFSKPRAAIPDSETDDDDEDDLDITNAVSKQLRNPSKQTAKPINPALEGPDIENDEETIASGDETSDLDNVKAQRKPVTKSAIKSAASSKSGLALKKDPSVIRISSSPEAVAKPNSHPPKKKRPVSRSSSSDPYDPRPIKRGRKPAVAPKTSASQPRTKKESTQYSLDHVEFDMDDMFSQISQRRKRKTKASSPASIRSTDSGKVDHVESEDEDEGEKKNRDENKVRVKVENGKQKVVMTDDEDDNPYERFRESKKRKTQRGRKPKKDSGNPTKSNKPATPLIPKIRPTHSQLRDQAIDRENGYSDSEQGANECPLHLLLKKQDLEKDQKEKKKPLEDIYRFPPTFDLDSDDEENLEDLEEKPQFPGSSPCRAYKDIVLDRSRGVIPASIARWLRDYQVDGVRFMHNAFILNTGVILGDDMGLGKTIQVISFLTAAFGKTGDIRDSKRMRKMRAERPDDWYPKVMIVCPGTLISNWERELDTWGWWQVHTYHGSKSKKEDALSAAEAGYLEIMITTYDTYRRDEAKINMIEWDAVIADECQKIKERKSGITEAMNRVNSLCRIGLTGTAIMNHYGELWNLLNWVRPGELGGYANWKKDIEDPLKIGQAHGATNAELARARNTANDLVKNLLPRMFLRRLKTLIAHQLPKKTDRVVFCKLGALQQEAYENYIESDVVQLVKYSTDPCDCGSGKTRARCCHTTLEDGRTLQQVVFPAIQDIQQLCNHLANWVPQDGEPIEKQEKNLEKLQIGLPDNWEKYYRRQPFENAIDPAFCGKWQVLQKLLAFWKENDDKVLIFSYSKKLLKMLQILLNNTHYNICYLDGDMSLEDRTNAVDSFNSDPSQFAFLISTKAGGVGLNIVSANKVVVFDPSWNPSHDLQAQDRAYRIGQRRDVEVFRLVCAGTIEEIIYARQIYKQQQANIGYEASFERRYFTGVMKDSNRRGELFGLKNLFTFQQDNVVLQGIVNKTNVAESKTGVLILNLESDAGMDENMELSNLEDENDAISQIQAIVGSNDEASTFLAPTSKLDPIQAILSEAGVEYTHENTEVIGTSKLEENISRKAVEANEDPTMRTMTAFQHDMSNDDRFQYGNVPHTVRVRQFNSLRKAFGYKYEENGKFALEVERWKPDRRATALEKFYRSRRRILALRGEMDEKEVPEHTGNHEVITIDDTTEGEEDEDEDEDPDEEVEDEEEGEYE